MVCPKCGKEMADEAWICPGCGSATKNYQAKLKTDPCYPQNDFTIREFEKKVESAYATSVTALVLCLWIGVVFSVVTWMKMKRIAVPEDVSQNPRTVSRLESAKRKLARANQFAVIPLVPWLLLGFYLLSAGFIRTSLAMVSAGICVQLLFVVLVWLGNLATGHLIFGGIEQVKNRK